MREQTLALQKAEASAAEALTQLQAAQEKVCFLSIVYILGIWYALKEINLNHGL